MTHRYSNSHKQLAAIPLSISLAMCSSVYAAAPSPTQPQAGPNCNPSNLLVPDATMTNCIVNNIDTTKIKLYDILSQFQKISDSNPDPTFLLFGKNGVAPGSRDSGTKGDIASVNYIAAYMKNLGYSVTVQSYPVPYSADRIKPIFNETAPLATSYAPGQDFSSAIFSGSAPNGVTAPLIAVGIWNLSGGASNSGCASADFANFPTGAIALLERGTCPNRTKVLNAIAAGASGVITSNNDDVNTGNTLLSPDGMTIPVYAYIPSHIGFDLYNQTQKGPVTVTIKNNVLSENRVTYNVIADSKYGNPHKVVVLDAHYDAIFGAGILDNASGTATIMEVARAMANTPTLNKMRYVFVGGEELGLLGSDYYVSSLTSKQLNDIVFDIDADVTATPNYTLDVSDPVYALSHIIGVSDTSTWDNRAINGSYPSIQLFQQYLASVNQPYTSRQSSLNIFGSDDNTFISSGVPIGSLVTGQGGGKTAEDAQIFGGTAGNFDVCADAPYVFCDNIGNTNNTVHKLVTKAFAYVMANLAQDTNLNNSSGNAISQQNNKGGKWKE